MTPEYEDRLNQFPPALAAAVREFIVWSDKQLLAEQIASTPKRPLYHYTDETAMKGILAKQQLWCFGHLHQKDKTEFAFSFGIARRIMRTIGRSTDFFTMHFGRMLEDFLDTNSLTDIFEFYMASLSRHHDDPGQWRAYGDRGRGYAIAFSPTLFQADETDLHEEANKNLHVARVIYGQQATAARHRRVIAQAARTASRHGRAHPEAVKQAGWKHYVRAFVLEVIASQLVWNCLTAKRRRYIKEWEVRYLLLGLRGKFDAYRKRHNGKPYIEAALPLKQPGSITEILVGPRAPTDAEAKLREFLDVQGYPAIPIRRSRARLRRSTERRAKPRRRRRR